MRLFGLDYSELENGPLDIRSHPLIPCLTTHFPLSPRPLANHIPKLLETLDVMPISAGAFSCLAGPRTWRVGTHLSPHQRCLLGIGLEETHEALAHSHLVVPAEQVEEARGVYDVDLSIEGLESLVAGVQDISRHKGSPKRLAIPEQVKSEVDELLSQIGAVEVRLGGAIERQLAQNVAEAASGIQEGLPRLDTLDDGGVLGASGEIEIQKAPLPDARVREDIPSFLPLSRMRERGILREGIPRHLQRRGHGFQCPRGGSCYNRRESSKPCPCFLEALGAAVGTGAVETATWRPCLLVPSSWRVNQCSVLVRNLRL